MKPKVRARLTSLTKEVVEKSISALELAWVNWVMYPPKILDLVAQFSRMTDLSLCFDHLTYSAAFHVIWAIPALRTLAITGVGKKPVRETVAESLGALAIRRKIGPFAPHVAP